MSNMNLMYILHKHLKFNIPQIKIYDQISTTSIIHAFLHKSAALPALSVSVSGITIHPAPQDRNYKVSFEFYILNTLPHQLSFSQAKYFNSATSEKHLSFSIDILFPSTKLK